MIEFENDTPGGQNNSNVEKEDTFFIQSKLNDFVIEVTGSAEGGKIRMAELNGSRCQRWKLTEEGLIQSEFNNFVLGIKYDDNDIEIPPCAHVISCSEDPNCLMQKWVYNEDERQIEFLGCMMTSSNLVLDIAWANMAQGATLHLWRKNHAASQTWTLVKHRKRQKMSLLSSVTEVDQKRWVNAMLDAKHETDEIVPPRSFYIESSMNGKVLEISSEEMGANLVLSDKDGTDGQIWCFDRRGYIKSEMNGLVIDICGDNLDAGAEIIMYGENKGDNQKWNLLDNGCIQSKFSGHALEIIRGYHRKNNMVHVNNMSGLRNQQWNFFPLDTSLPESSFYEESYSSLSTIKDPFGSFYIQSVKTGLTFSAVQVKEEEKPRSTRLLHMIVRKEEAFTESWIVKLTRKKKDDLAQKWTLTYNDELKSELNGLVLDVATKTLNRHSLVLYEQNDGLNQKWKICEDGRIEAKLNGMVIENVSAGDNASSHITLKPRSDSDRQLWEWDA